MLGPLAQRVLLLDQVKAHLFWIPTRFLQSKMKRLLIRPLHFALAVAVIFAHRVQRDSPNTYSSCPAVVTLPASTTTIFATRVSTVIVYDTAFPSALIRDGGFESDGPLPFKTSLDGEYVSFAVTSGGPVFPYNGSQYLYVRKCRYSSIHEADLLDSSPWIPLQRSDKPLRKLLALI